MSWFGVGSYAAAVLAFSVVAAAFIGGRNASPGANWIGWAGALSALWAAGNIAVLIRSGPLLGLLLVDAMHVHIWTLAMLVWLDASTMRRRFSLRTALILASVGLAAWAVVAVAFASDAGGVVSARPLDRKGASIAMVGMGLVGLLAVEQVYRNAVVEQRDKLRLLCFAIGAIFVIDAFVYAQAAILGGLSSVFWEGRGLANAALAPLIAIAVRHPYIAGRRVGLSRRVAFYTASLVGVGSYLVAMAMAAYVMRGLGGDLALVLQVVFVVSALAILAYILFSTSLRAHLKVLLVKHFYKVKYDYRQEWLRLTERLGRSGEIQTLSRNALEGIAGIVGSDGADLWLTSDGKTYDWIVSLRASDAPKRRYSDKDLMVAFLGTTGWIIDTEQYEREPERYGHTIGQPGDALLPAKSLIVPLDHRGYLQGFVVLDKPASVKSLDFEDHDILKTAGRQVAVVLAQAHAQLQLAATLQFEAVNKLSTFLMHDLKNLIAQQELLVSNARRFMHRPGFVEDAVHSIESGVQRMRLILNRLQKASISEHTSRVDLDKLLYEVCNECSDRQPSPNLVPPPSGVRVEIDRERLAMAITHAIRNAQDATLRDGAIDISLEVSGGFAEILIKDSGEGMTPDFVRDRLFRPFDSTKGAKGMGVGAYQIRETLRAVGGSVEVKSEPGQGTELRLKLPIPGGGLHTRSVA